MDAHDTDTDHMRVALDLAVRGWGHVSPNPMVGALVLAGDEVVGRGWYEGPSGAPHAEVRALREAGDRARGATIVCTLEPCNHHGATPPCTEALIDAGVARVVVGATDPNPLVDGSGLARLRAAGLDVRDGVLAAEAHRLNAGVRAARDDRDPVRDLEGGDLARRQDGRARRLIALDHLREGTARRAPPACVGGRDRRRRRHGHRRRPGAHGPPSGSARRPAAAPRRGGRRRPCAGDRSGVRRERAHTGRDDRRAESEPSPARFRPRSRSRCAPPTEPAAWRRRPCSTSSGSATCKGVVLEGGATLAWSFLRDGAVDRIVQYVAPRLDRRRRRTGRRDGGGVRPDRGGAGADVRASRPCRSRSPGGGRCSRGSLRSSARCARSRRGAWSSAARSS